MQVDPDYQSLENRVQTNGHLARRYPVSSIVFPIVFLFLHPIVLNIMAFLRIFSYARQMGLRGLDLLQVFSDVNQFAEYMTASDAQNYGSIWAMLILLPLYILYLWSRSRRDPMIVKFKQHRFRIYAEGLILIVGTLGLTQLWMSFLLLFEDADNFIGRALRSYLVQTESLTDSESSVIIQLLALVILVPLAEELLFRGIIQGELSLRFSRPVTVIVSSLLFALFHFNLIQGSYVFFAGVILSLSYALTDNLLIPIFMHMFFNLIGGGVLQKILGLSEKAEMILLIALLVFIIPAIVVLVRWLRCDKLKAAASHSETENDTGIIR